MDWRSGMSRTYELVKLSDDWRERETVQHLRDGSVTFECKGLRYSAAFTPYEGLSDGYYRIYMVCVQGADVERVPIATVRMQSPKKHIDGYAESWKSTGYSPLVELDADYPPVGWTAKGNVVAQAAAIVEGHCPAPCSHPDSTAEMEPWTADDGDTWLDCLEAVLSKASMHVEVDGMGRVLFAPDVDRANVSPVWTFDDAAYGLPSILMPDVDDDSDFYDLKNKVEVVYSDDSVCYVGTAVNADPRSKGSTVSRGYVNAMRKTNPEISEPVTQAKVSALAEKMLAEQDAATHTASFSHAFVPGVGVWKCVRLDYTRFGYRADGIVMKQVLRMETSGIVDTDIEYEEAVNAK